MGYFIAFGLIYVGYSLLDWGHYVFQHEKVSLWYLMSGLGTPPEAAPGSTNQTPAKSSVSAATPIINPVTGKPVYFKGG